MTCLLNSFSYLLPFVADHLNNIMLYYEDDYDSHFLLLKIAYFASDILLHSGVGRSDIFVLWSCLFLDVAVSMITNASGT